jgi:formylglycine-generating enzyme required for sulfatase activity
MSKVTPDNQFCPACGQPLEPAQTECPICGFDLTQVNAVETSPVLETIPVQEPVPVQAVDEVKPEPVLEAPHPSSFELFQKLLDEAERFERADDLVAALSSYRGALDFLEAHQENDPSLKIAAHTLPQLIRRLEQLLAQQATSSLKPVEAAKKPNGKKPLPTKPIMAIGGMLFLLVIFLGLRNPVQNMITERAQAVKTSAAIALEAEHNAQTLTAEPTATRTFTATFTSSSTFTLTPTPTFTMTLTPTPTLTPTITPTPGIGSTRVSEMDDMVMVYVPGGTFVIGSNSGTEDSKPPHSVTLSPYWIDKTEVSNAMYAKCVNAGKCQPPRHNYTSIYPSYYNNSTYANYPVVYVYWDNAESYCNWAQRRLPTEAEWEAAASGPQKLTYPWGNTVDNNYFNALQKRFGTTEVDAYPLGASYYGALNMAGNVWEWVNDFFDKYRSNAPTINPTGPTSSTLGHVDRGGSWSSPNKTDITTYNRIANKIDITKDLIGFRCAMSQTP